MVCGYENYFPGTDDDGHANNLRLASGNSFAERLSDASAQFVHRTAKFDNNNFAPRFGFAWDPRGNGKMAIRGGYGITFDRNTAYGNWASNPPLLATVNLGAQFGNTFTYSLGDPDQALPWDILWTRRYGRGSIRTMASLESEPTPDAFDPDFRHSLCSQLVLWRPTGTSPRLDIWKSDYIGSAGHKLFNSVNVNRYQRRSSFRLRME